MSADIENCRYAALILYSSPNDVTESDAGSVEDLFISMEDRILVPATNVDLSITSRSSRTAKQFFCPCCQDKPIKISKSGDSLKCPRCNWNASSIGITSISDLLQRDADPYPELTKERNRLISQIRGQSNLGDDSILSTSQINRRMSYKRIRSRSHAILPPRLNTLEKLETVGRDTPMQRFTNKQQQHEKQMFSEYAPKTNSKYCSIEDEKEKLTCLQKTDIKDIIPPVRSTPKQILLKKDEPARRRVPLPKVVISDMKDEKFGEVLYDKISGWSISRYVNDLVPEIRVDLYGGCLEDDCMNDKGCCSATIQVRNKMDLKLDICFSNWIDDKEIGKIELDSKQMKSFNVSEFYMKDRPMNRTVYKEKVCAKGGVMSVSFIYSFYESRNETEETKTEDIMNKLGLIGQEWKMIVFVRHSNHKKNLTLMD